MVPRRTKAGGPPIPGLLDRYLEIERTVKSFDMTWEQACTAYNREYRTKVKPDAAQRWLRRYRLKHLGAEAA